jgi:hypothetical protein
MREKGMLPPCAAGSATNWPVPTDTNPAVYLGRLVG